MDPWDHFFPDLKSGHGQLGFLGLFFFVRPAGMVEKDLQFIWLCLHCCAKADKCGG